MSDIPMVYTYRGKPLEEMTKDELIEAVKNLGKEVNERIEDDLKRRVDLFRGMMP